MPDFVTVAGTDELAEGEVLADPAEQSVPDYEVRVDGDEVQVGV